MENERFFKRIFRLRRGSWTAKVGSRVYARVLMGFGSIKNRAVTRLLELLLRQKPIIFSFAAGRVHAFSMKSLVD